jgi:hypothetical protein
MATIISSIGKVERLHKHDVVRAVYDPGWDRYILVAENTTSGNVRALESWTYAVREHGLTWRDIVRQGAGVDLASLETILQ